MAGVMTLQHNSQMRRCLVLVLVATVGGSLADAQELQPSAVRRSAVSLRPIAERVVAQEPEPARNEFAVRAALGILGSFAGLVAGGFIGYGMPDGECGDDPGLCEMLTGMLIGTVSGAALGAALPRRGSTCGFGGRAALGVVGALLLGLGGGAIGAQADSQWILLTAPVGAGLGGAIGASLC